jgi:hypothetical protein
MDADRRHDLKTNELGEALLSARESLSDRRVGYAAAAVIAIAALYLAWQWRTRTVEHGRQLQWEAVESISVDPENPTPAIEQLRALSAEMSDPGVRAAAELRMASLLKQKALQTLAPEDFQAALRTFETLAGRTDAPAAMRSAALFNVGQMHENLFEFDQAKTAYKTLRDDPALTGQVFQTVAAQRLTVLDGFGTRLDMTPGLPPAPPPETQAAAPSADAAAQPGAMEIRVPAAEITSGPELVPAEPAAPPTDAPAQPATPESPQPGAAGAEPPTEGESAPQPAGEPAPPESAPAPTP